MHLTRLLSTGRAERKCWEFSAHDFRAEKHNRVNFSQPQIVILFGTTIACILFSFAVMICHIAIAI